MKRFSYRDRDYSFGQAMLTLRSAMGITQSELADLLGISRRAVGAWEAGSKYPKADHLKKFIEFAVQHRAFADGDEADEIRALWQAARQKVLLNEAWLTALLSPNARQQAVSDPPVVQSVSGSLRKDEYRTPSSSLPFQPTPFIGRETELNEITRLLEDRACRLLTLLGPGGIGKTRLGIEFASIQAQTYTDGIVFVALAPISIPSQIVPAIGEALNLVFQGQGDPRNQLLEHLRERHMLLVLDNFEHIVEGADLVYDILLRAPHITIVVTSRVRLNLQAEWLFDVEGLAYPPNGSGDLAELAQYSAVELFVQRATQVQPRFPLTTGILKSIVRICQQIAGMPLAIELAAAGVRTLSVAEIAEQIGSNLDALTTSLRDVQPRHRSMRAVFDHSWNLLSEPERVLFTRLSVFRGGCTIEAVEQVTGATLPALLTLVDKSLVRQMNTPIQTTNLIEPRFFLLEPIREYAVEKLTTRGQLAAVQQSHALYYLALAEAARAQWETPTAESALVTVDFDHDNMRTALQWAVSGGDAMLGLRLAEALVRYWRSRVYLEEACYWLETLLNLNVNQSDLAALDLRMRSTYAAAMIFADQRDYAHAGVLFEQSRALRQTLGEGSDETTLLINQAQQARSAGEYPRATALLEESLVFYRAAGDMGTLSSGGYGFVLYFLGHVLREQGDFTRARAFYRECQDFHISVGDREGATQGLLGLSDVARDMGDAAELCRSCNECLARYREFGTQWAIGFCLNNLALAEYLDNNLDEALALISESVAMFRAQKSPGSIAEVLVTLGAVLLARGDLDGAYNALSESVRLAWKTGPRLLIAVALETLGCTMTRRGAVEVQQAIQFLSAAAQMRQEMGTPVRPADRPVLEHALQTTRAALGSKTFESLWAQAEKESLETILQLIPGVISEHETRDEVQPPSAPQVMQTVDDPAAINPSTPSTRRWRTDWDDAVTVSNFYGREWELNLLTEWIVDERCRVVTVLGLGGIGKSALTVTLMHRIADQFDLVIWGSMRDTSTCDGLMDELLQVLGHQTVNDSNTVFERRLAILLEHMRNNRILLVLDNLESVMEDGVSTGRLLPGYVGFREFLRKSAETEHQSCVLLTSREKPTDLIPLEGSRTPVRALRLTPLDAASSEKLLAEKGIKGTPENRVRLIEAYTGNPLALKIVSQTIVDLFDGEITPFLEHGEMIFGSLRELLNQQFARLTPLEQSVLVWLAILREPSTLNDLLAVVVTPVPRGKLLEAVDSLHRSSLIERAQQQGSFTLQSVVMEYMTTRIVAEASDEVQSENLSAMMHTHGFQLAQAREYVREIQRRLIIEPILERLHGTYTQQAALEEHLIALLTELATRDRTAQGYAPANLVTLVHTLRGHLRGLNLSGLALRGVFLQGVEMQDANLSESTLRDSVFNQTFDALSVVGVSPTGIYWAAGSRQGEVRLWTDNGLTLNRVWRAHADMVCDLTFSPDGSLLATTGSWDGLVKLWDVTSGALLWSGKHTSQAYAVAFSPDGSLIASTGFDATVYLWDMRSSAPLQTLSHPDAVTAITWSPDGQVVVTGDLKGHIRWWKAHENDPPICILTQSEHTNCVEGLAFSPDGSLLASASWDNTVKLWDVASGTLWRTLNAHTNRVTRITWSPDGRLLASAGRDQNIWLWDVEQDSYRGALMGHHAGIYGLAFTPLNQTLVSVSEDGTLRVWDVVSGQSLHVMQGYTAALNDVDWSPDGTQLVSGGSDTLLTLYAVNGERPSRLLSGHRGIVIGAGWSFDGRWLASSEWNNAIRMWHPVTGATTQVLRQADAKGDYFDSLAWSPTALRLAVGTYTRGVHLFEMSPQQQWAGRYLPAPIWIRHVDWHPDGTQLAGGGADGVIYVWDTAEGILVQRLLKHHSSVIDLAWSPDGTRLASGSRGQDGGELFVWDMQSGTSQYSLKGHPGIVYSLAWGVDGNRIVTGSSDGRLRWWDVESRECILTQDAHNGTVQALKRSPDGLKLASCGSDGAIMLWDLSTGAYLQTLRRDRPYERLKIRGIKGLTEAQKATLVTLGAVE